MDNVFIASGCGARSSTSASISRPSRPAPRPGPGSTTGSTITTLRGLTRCSMDAPPRRSILGATRHLRGMPRRWRQRRWRHENHHGIPPNNRRQAVQRLGSTSNSSRYARTTQGIRPMPNIFRKVSNISFPPQLVPIRPRISEDQNTDRSNNMPQPSERNTHRVRRGGVTGCGSGARHEYVGCG